MATSADGTLTAREGQDLPLKIEDHGRDLSSTTVYVYGFAPSDDRVQLGAATGADVGTAFIINVDTGAVDPSTYRLEVWGGDDAIVYPTEDETPLLEIINARSND